MNVKCRKMIYVVRLISDKVLRTTSLQYRDLVVSFRENGHEYVIPYTSVLYIIEVEDQDEV